MSVEKLSPAGSGCNLVLALAGAVISKVPVVHKSHVVVPLDSFEANQAGTYMVEDPDLEVPKATGQAWVGLDKIYWDDTAKNFTTTSTSNTLAGYARRAADSADTTGRLVLTPATIA